MSKSKKIVLFLSLVITALIFVGCGSVKTENLKALAKVEQQGLKELDPIAKETITTYERWLRGDMTYNALRWELTDLNIKMEEIKNKNRQERKKIKLTVEDRKSDLYIEGLEYGSRPSTDVADMIAVGLIGKVTNTPAEDKQANAPEFTHQKISKAELKEEYQRLKEKYNKDRQELEKTINKTL